ncbi:MAG: hypothetical protein U0L05_00845 [Schaedlerella sp.]|nr:hypothetical protein [Schaedlerella sp.]
MTDSKTNQKIIDNYDYLTKAASSGDCTGLIPSLPANKAELESYNELYQYLPPAANKKKKDSDIKSYEK